MSLEAAPYDFGLEDQYSTLNQKIFPYTVKFYQKPFSCCVGIVDMVNSTKIAASLGMIKMSTYYQTFLNLTSKIIMQFGGVVIKNIGDCLLFFFPPIDKDSTLDCLHCGIALEESHQIICDQLKIQKLPCVDYRISLDFGPVIPMSTSHTKSIDMIGPAINMCSKINRAAEKNSVVIGGDLYELAKRLRWISFYQIHSYNVGFKHHYPIYAVKKIDEKV